MGKRIRLGRSYVLLATMLFAMSSMLAFADTTITIGVTMNNLATEYTANLAKAIEKKAKEVNVKIVMDDAQGKADIQTSQIENFIARKVDAVIMQPIEAEAMSPSVKKLQAAGIPIINVNSITTAEPDAYVGSRDEEAGVLAVNYIASCIKGKGNIVMMHGHPGQSAEIQRTDGAKSAIAKYPDIKLIAEQTAEWNRNQAMNLMQNWLSANKDKINGVFAQNDEMAMGALKALEDSKVKKQIVLVGVDGIRDALKAVKDGRLNATVLQDATGQGAGAVEIAIKAAKKESFEKNTYIPFVLVTSENIGKFYTK